MNIEWCSIVTIKDWKQSFVLLIEHLRCSINNDDFNRRLKSYDFDHMIEIITIIFQVFHRNWTSPDIQLLPVLYNFVSFLLVSLINSFIFQFLIQFNFLPNSLDTVIEPPQRFNHMISIIWSKSYDFNLRLKSWVENNCSNYFLL